MKKEEVKKKYSDSVARGIIDEDLINYIVEKEIEDEDLNPILEKIQYTDKLDNIGTYCYYDPFDKSFKINSHILDKKDYEDDVDLVSTYSSLISSIYKELTYARQELLFQKVKNYYCELDGSYKKTSQEKIREMILIDLYQLVCQASERKYQKYKTMFPSEHEANFYSQYKTMNFENEYNLYSKKTEAYRTLTLTKLLLEGYKYNLFKQVVSPVDRLQSKSINDSGINYMMSNLFNNYERLIYGMPVTDKTINSIANISKGMVIPKCSTFEEVEKRLLKRK